ncbi:hypothetical protein BGX28_003738 [Mortierella sp. GBA30]|nr:hypothetical protein BGX28_003738 [Mortierella sp. GBA30]
MYVCFATFDQDENYEAYYDNADTYRRQLEERYPLACTNCLDKVQKVLVRQNYQLKTTLLNSTLSKSRGDAIAPSRKYPTMLWLVAGASWLTAHAALIAIELRGPDTLPSLEALERLRYRSQNSEALTIGAFIKTVSRISKTAIWPWSSSFKKPLQDLTEDDRATVWVITLMCIAMIGLHWDPLQFAIQKTLRVRVRTRWYYRWARIGTFLLVALQLFALFSTPTSLCGTWCSGGVLVLHLLCLGAFISGRTVQEPLVFKFDSTSRPSSPSGESPLDSNNETPPYQSSRSSRASEALRNRSNALPELARSATDPSNNAFDAHTSSSVLFSSRPTSPDINQISWSTKKSSQPASTQSPASFGVYRDPGQDNTALHNPSRMHMSTAFQSGHHTNGYTPLTDNTFRSRAYEPSPLANPSAITNMGLSNMSLGEMLGFPSARFQPPENLFAHRSAKDTGTKAVDAWSFRTPTEARASGAERSFRSGSPAMRTRFADNTDDVAMDDETDDYPLQSSTRRTNLGHTMDEAAEDDQHAGFHRPISKNRSRDGWTVDGREAFAAQTYFPPEPETGLEANFSGAVKIVDDYPPQRQEPQTIFGRDLMLKKRMARRWVILLLLCRCISLLETVDRWTTMLQRTGQAIFVAVILHASAFWALGEYRAMLRYLERKPSQEDKATRSKIEDPFKPTDLDIVCSVSKKSYYYVFL